MCGWWERVKVAEFETELLMRLVISARGTLLSFLSIPFFLFLFLKDWEANWGIEILLLQTGGTFSLLLWLDMVEVDVVDSIAKK